jgi:hypothetical protein
MRVTETKEDVCCAFLGVSAERVSSNSFHLSFEKTGRFLQLFEPSLICLAIVMDSPDVDSKKLKDLTDLTTHIKGWFFS